jgi:hypothetical protein
VLWFCALLVLALDSKEMAVMLPAIIGFYELLYHRPRSLRALLGVAPAPLVSGIIVLAYYFGRVQAKEGIANAGGYRASISLAEYFRQTGHYLIEVLYKPDRTLPAHITILFLLALAAIALFFRSKGLAFSALLFAVGILPVAFIAWRGLNAVYIPLGGLAMFLAVTLVEIRRQLWRWLGWKPDGDEVLYGLTPGRILLFAVVATALLRVHPTARGHYESWVREEYTDIRAVMNQMPQLHPELGRGKRILIVKDPFKQFNWACVFIARLVYREESLGVDRLVSMEKKPTAAQIAAYDVRLAYEDGKLRDVPPEEVPAAP